MAGEPEIGNSTLEERIAYIKEKYPCKGILLNTNADKFNTNQAWRV
ncbi:hypothetical protein [Butyrivibrio sp.]|nr:hypothetical protein [Butyrivibrio sp.]MBQ9302572.1 hypothetical protein [Butyrivibrio sp.]